MKEKLVVFGGSFNPPTNAHFSLAEQVLDFPEVKGVLFVPVSDLYPKEELIPAKYRVDMLCEVIRKNPRFMISLVEVNSPYLMNTIDSMRELKKEFPEYDLVFLMGSDNLAQLPQWEGANELVEEFSFIVVSRNGTEVKKLLNQDPFLQKNKDKFYCMEEFVGTDISSTAIRKRIREGKSIRYLVPDEIYEYLQMGNLYK